MVNPYPDIRTWAVPTGVLAATLEAVHPSTHPGVEAGVFWLGNRDTEASVTAVVIPHGRGVDELPGCWRVSPEVFGRIGSWATATGVTLLGVCHTHSGPSPARLSIRDRTHSIKVPSILAVVIARDGLESEPELWGWYVWRDGDYQPLRSNRLRLGHGNPPTIWRADVDGVFPI